MVEFHGWAVISYHFSDDNESKEIEFMNKFMNLLNDKYSLYLERKIFDIKEYNLLTSFQAFGNFNHKPNEFAPIEIFEWLAKNSSGSYGLLYIYDDEDVRYKDQFQVYTLKKGQLISEKKDCYLYPIPMG